MSPRPLHFNNMDTLRHDHSPRPLLLTLNLIKGVPGVGVGGGGEAAETHYTLTHFISKNSEIFSGCSQKIRLRRRIPLKTELWCGEAWETPPPP